MIPVATWTGVSKQYEDGPLAVDDVSFLVNPGEIVVVVGPNGSGKTTIMEMVSGLRVPTSGAVTVNGTRVRPGGEQRSALGVQLQEAGLPMRIKVKEAIAAVACLYRDPGPVEEILTNLGLDAYRDSMVENLSGGWQRRLDVALACIGQPQLLVLDEPTSGLDPVARARLWEFLRTRRAAGMAVLASTHDLAEAEAFADRLIVLRDGQIVLDGPVGEVLTQAGGEWRLRLIGADHSADRLAAQAGLTFLPAGDARTALGTREQVLALADQIEAAHERGEVQYQDLLRGPVRLEDVFAFATRKDQTHAAA